VQSAGDWGYGLVMEFVSLARGVEIGANSYLLRGGGHSVVLDAGMHPKREGMEAAPDFSLLPEGGPDAVLVTHAHQDHVGALPLLTREHRASRVFMTDGTARVADAMLHNSVNVMTRQKEELGIESYPLFTHRGVEISREAWQPCRYRMPYDLEGERATKGSDASFEFYPAGHILGAAGALLRMDGRTVFYTGDVNFENQSLIRGADFPESGVDVLIMETTRGDSPTPAGFTRVREEERLCEEIQSAFAEGGSVMIPVFALGKTQELLAMLWRMQLRGDLGRVPIYIGGLSTKLTTIYDAFAKDTQRLQPELQLLTEVAPYVISGNEASSLAPRKKCVFALSSGMMTENTISNIFAKKILGDPHHSLFFIGYCDPESPAGRIRAAAPGDPVRLDPRGPEIPLRCRIRDFTFSAHATRESLFNYASALRPKKILLVHGDRSAIDWFHLRLHRELPETEVIIPEPGRRIAL
jgi:Cft2 family RNA processing exonuclease